MRNTPTALSSGLKRGPWTADEDHLLVEYIRKNGHGKWRTLPKNAGLNRCGKSCRLRWINYLRPDIKRGKFSPEEEDTIIQLHKILGNKWSAIAARLPGRTDNEIKNYWNTNIRKRLFRMGFGPKTQASRYDYFGAPTPSSHPPASGFCESSTASSSSTTTLPSWREIQDFTQSVDILHNIIDNTPDHNFNLPTSASAMTLSSQSPDPQYHPRSYDHIYQLENSNHTFGRSLQCHDQPQFFPNYDFIINHVEIPAAHGLPLMDNVGHQLIQEINFQEQPNYTGTESTRPLLLVDAMEGFGFSSVNIATTAHNQSCCSVDQKSNDFNYMFMQG